MTFPYWLTLTGGLALMLAAATALSRPVYAAEPPPPATWNMRGTVVTFGPTDRPGAMAEVSLHNVNINYYGDNGCKVMIWDRLVMEVCFTWNSNAAGDDRITVIPIGCQCVALPAEIDVPEDATGTIYIYPAVS